MNHNLGEGNCNALFIEEDLQISGQAPPGGKNSGLVCFHGKAQHNPAVGQFFFAKVSRLGKVKPLIIRKHLRQCRLQHCFQLFQVGGIGYAYVAEGKRAVAAAVLEVSDVRIVYDFQISAGILNGGGADTDAAYDAAEVIQDDDIPNAVLAFKNDEETRDDVFDQA